MLGGPDARYQVPLPGEGEAKRAILDTYTKEHSAEYQSQALIDLARPARRVGVPLPHQRLFMGDTASEDLYRQALDRIARSGAQLR